MRVISGESRPSRPSTALLLYVSTPDASAPSSRLLLNVGYAGNMRVKLDVVDETVVLSGEGLLLALDPEVLVDGKEFDLISVRFSRTWIAGGRQEEIADLKQDASGNDTGTSRKGCGGNESRL